MQHLRLSLERNQGRERFSFIVSAAFSTSFVLATAELQNPSDLWLLALQHDACPDCYSPTAKLSSSGSSCRVVVRTSGVERFNKTLF